MISGTVPMSRSINGEAEHNLLNQRDHLGSGGISVTTYHDRNCGDERVSRKSDRDAEENINGNVLPDATNKKARLEKEMTLQDMYNNQFDIDDDDDDSDWEPLQKSAAVVKWFCANCTMVNLDDVVHCDICGEHKDSGIIKQGFFASPFLKEAGLTQNKSDEIERYKDSCSRIPLAESSTVVGFDERMLLHSEVEMKPHPHPERPDRLRAIAASLATAGIFPGRCFPISAREITQEELRRVHSVEHIESVEFSSQILSSYFTPDTYANEHSALSARLAAGLCADLASTIFCGHAKNGFALVRPPGHHAGVKYAMGFCLHNNAAVAALAAQAAGAKKVLIVDWDVHHGNGTQEIFEGSKSVLYVSLHRHEGGKFYPGTGAAHDVGTMGAEGYCVNLPWCRGGVGDNDYIFAFQHVVLPIASEFAPDFTIISAGFDAARGDPLGCCDVTPAGFAEMTHMLNDLSSGKLLVILEGGYNLRSISSSATAVIKVLLGESPGCEMKSVIPSKSGLLTVLEVLKIQMTFWPKLESILSKLQSQWGTYAFPDRNKQELEEGFSRTAIFEVSRFSSRTPLYLFGCAPAYKTSIRRKQDKKLRESEAARASVDPIEREEPNEDECSNSSGQASTSRYTEPAESSRPSDKYFGDEYIDYSLKPSPDPRPLISVFELDQLRSDKMYTGSAKEDPVTWSPVTTSGRRVTSSDMMKTAVVAVGLAQTITGPADRAYYQKYSADSLSALHVSQAGMAFQTALLNHEQLGLANKEAKHFRAVADEAQALLEDANKKVRILEEQLAISRASCNVAREGFQKAEVRARALEDQARVAQENEKEVRQQGFDAGWAAAEVWYEKQVAHVSQLWYVRGHKDGTGHAGVPALPTREIKEAYRSIVAAADPPRPDPLLADAVPPSGPTEAVAGSLVPEGVPLAEKSSASEDAAVE